MTDRLPPKCPECNDTGERDSGGTHPWGEPIYLACDCKDAEIGRRWRTDNSLEAWFPITAQQLRKQADEIERLTRELAELTADRDSWIEQASQRTQETVEAMQQVDAYRMRCEAQDSAPFELVAVEDPDAGTIYRMGERIAELEAEVAALHSAPQEPPSCPEGHGPMAGYFEGWRCNYCGCERQGLLTPGKPVEDEHAGT